MTKVAAVDIGATSGRVLVAELVNDSPALTGVSRFANHPVQVDGRWIWDIDQLQHHVATGLVAAQSAGASSFGIDTWAVDYGVLRDGALVGPVAAYRDPRHERGMAIVDAAIGWTALYSITGTQRMPINTIYQIAADDPQRITADTTFAMVPDLLSYRLTGQAAADVTNASSTGMLDPRTRTWSPEVLAALGLPDSAFPRPDEPGLVRGPAIVPGIEGLPLIGVATHDTASAFAGAPIADRDSALVLSLGTWALIGAEVVGAVPTPQARELNVTHELGVDGTVRVLRNVSGMWLLEECRRDWAAADGAEVDVVALLEAAAQAPRHAAIFDIDASDLAAPGQSAETIGHHLVGHWDGSRGAIVRTILESLVARLAVRARQIEGLLGTPRDTVNVVGGACRNTMLMQWLADATGKRVVAGPVEATAVGNAAVQWTTLGVVADLADARRRISLMPEIREYLPCGDQADWVSYAERLKG